MRFAGPVAQVTAYAPPDLAAATRGDGISSAPKDELGRRVVARSRTGSGARGHAPIKSHRAIPAGHRNAKRSPAHRPTACNKSLLGAVTGAIGLNRGLDGDGLDHLGVAAAAASENKGN